MPSVPRAASPAVSQRSQGCSGRMATKAVRPPATTNTRSTMRAVAPTATNCVLACAVRLLPREGGLLEPIDLGGVAPPEALALVLGEVEEVVDGFEAVDMGTDVDHAAVAAPDELLNAEL